MSKEKAGECGPRITVRYSAVEIRAEKEAGTLTIGVLSGIGTLRN